MQNTISLIDNKTNKFRDDLALELKSGSRVAIAAACFSMYAFQELKGELEKIEELRFIFTSPTFTTERAEKAKREFYIPRLNRERSIYGDEFEVRLRNELTQKAIAKECAEWIKKKVRFRSNCSKDYIQNFMLVDDKSYYGFNDFTTVDLGCERGNNALMVIQKLSAPYSQLYLDSFNTLWNDKNRLQDVTNEVVENIAAAYNENAPEFIYFVSLYNIFHEFLENLSEDELPNEATGFKETKIWKTLFDFQKDAALGLINKLERYNGCILADSVGLGKTFTALAVMRYYQQRNKNILVLCPKKLRENWVTYKSNYMNNPLVEDRFRYDVLCHTDLSRKVGKSGEIDLARFNWETYDLVVIDESHNFRNGGATRGGEDERENRYSRLLNQVIRKGVKTKVLMLSATPVNNRFNDLKNQLALAYEGEATNLDSKLNLTRSVTDVFKSAQGAFNEWSKLSAPERTTKKLLSLLSFDFFELLDSVTIARSRKHIEKYYDLTQIGAFPERLAPISLNPPLTISSQNELAYDAIYDDLLHLSLAVYTPSAFIHESKKEKYADLFGDEKINKRFTQENREQGIRRLMTINLMKRMESSIHSFRLTLEHVLNKIENAIKLIESCSKDPKKTFVTNEISIETQNDEESEAEQFSIGTKKVQIEIGDMDFLRWKEELESDVATLKPLLEKAKKITPELDWKLQNLLSLISKKIELPINDGNKKIIVFTAFADTADYLYEHVSRRVKEKYGLETALVTGDTNGKTTIPRFSGDFNTVLACFSPISKERDKLASAKGKNIDVLIATDCISEGQNLQDCDYLVNYDIHWNPVRIIQRFGRIDRIGSKNARVQLVNFWPDVSLDEYIALRQKVETRMKAVDLTATGDDNIISDEKVDLEYRKKQLQRLREEVVDLEDASNGASIMDLGLNEFRLDLIDYIKKSPNVEQAPLGLHAIVHSDKNCPRGVIYVLKNRSKSFGKNRQNRLHPFYLAYVDEDGKVVSDYLAPKEILDKMRALCKGRSTPIAELYRAFNEETRDGRDMKKYSELLQDAITAIVDKKKEKDLDSLFRTGGLSSLTTTINGLDDFELIAFLVVR